jgi:hypothetical protein
LFACLAAVGSSCAILGLREQTAEIAAHGFLSVKVEAMAPSVPTYAVAWTTGADGKPETIGLQPVGEGRHRVLPAAEPPPLQHRRLVRHRQEQGLRRR